MALVWIAAKVPKKMSEVWIYCVCVCMYVCVCVCVCVHVCIIMYILTSEKEKYLII